MSPSNVSVRLGLIACYLENTPNPDRTQVLRDLHALLASVESASAPKTASQGVTGQSYTVGIYAEPGSQFDHEDVSATSRLESPFREAGASHFSWLKGGCYMHVPKDSVAGVLQALRAAQEGNHGDDLKEALAAFRHEYTLDESGKAVADQSVNTAD